MKKFLLIALALSAGLAASAQTYMPVTLTGFNADVVADGAGSAMVSTNNDVDGGGYVFVAQNFINPSGQSPSAAGSLPNGGLITSAVTTTPGLTYQLAPYTANNSLRIASAASGSLTFSSPSSASDIYVLMTPVAYTTTYLVNVTVNFSDATTQVFTGISVPNWFGGANPAFSGTSRVNRTNNTISVNAQGPRMYQYKLTLNASNTAKPIQSIQFSNTSAATSGNILNVMAVTTAGGAPSLPNDVGIISSTAPNSGCTLTSQETITVTLKNFGSAAQSNIPVSYTLNNGTPVTEVFPGPLASNATVNYAFTAKADLSAIATYNLIVTTGLSNDGQASNDSFSRTVTKFAVPNTPTVAVSGGSAICPGNTTLLTASGAAGAIYQWYKDGAILTGITSASYAASQAGSYTVVANSNGCTSAVSNAVAIILSQVPATPSLTASGLTTICTGNSVTFTASSSTAGATYFWLLDGTTISGANSATYTATSPGRYSVMAVSGGCTSFPSMASIVTINPTPVTPTITQSGFTLTSSSGIGNQWYLNGAVIPGATGQTITATANGAYTVKVTNNGCNSATSNAVNITISGIENEDPALAVNVYPNPTSGLFYISVPGGNEAEVVITDLTGRIIKKQTLTEDQTQINLCTPAAKGIYLIRITSGNRIATQKLFVE